jgi:hypothetical protein
VSYIAAELGVSGSTAIKLSKLVFASVDSAGLLQLTLTMSHATNVVVDNHPEISVNSQNSVLRTEARFGLTIGEVDLEVWGTNGSHVASGLPPEKWSSLMYGLWPDGGLTNAKEETHG